MVLKAKNENDQVVAVSVFDLNEFIHAGPNDMVFVEDEEYNQWCEPKGSLTFIEVVEP